MDDSIQYYSGSLADSVCAFSPGIVLVSDISFQPVTWQFGGYSAKGVAQTVPNVTEL